jgi:hypothetical protein
MKVDWMSEEDLLKEFEKMLESRVNKKKSPPPVPKKKEDDDDHSDHEVIWNAANGNRFRYCKDCKIEVK